MPLVLPLTNFRPTSEHHSSHWCSLPSCTKKSFTGILDCKNRRTPTASGYSPSEFLKQPSVMCNNHLCEESLSSSSSKVIEPEESPPSSVTPTSNSTTSSSDPPNGGVVYFDFSAYRTTPTKV